MILHSWHRIPVFYVNMVWTSCWQHWNVKESLAHTVCCTLWYTLVLRAIMWGHRPSSGITSPPSIRWRHWWTCESRVRAEQLLWDNIISLHQIKTSVCWPGRRMWRRRRRRRRRRRCSWQTCGCLGRRGRLHRFDEDGLQVFGSPGHLISRWKHANPEK